MGGGGSQGIRCDIGGIGSSPRGRGRLERQVKVPDDINVWPLWAGEARKPTMRNDTRSCLALVGGGGSYPIPSTSLALVGGGGSVVKYEFPKGSRSLAHVGGGGSETTLVGRRIGTIP